LARYNPSSAKGTSKGWLAGKLAFVVDTTPTLMNAGTAPLAVGMGIFAT